MNVNTEKRVPLIHLEKIHSFDAILDIQQTSEFAATQDASKAKHYSNLKEIILHFKLRQSNKDGSERQLIYCQLKLSTGAIKLLLKT